MTYQSIEASLHSGQPVELYRFALGATVWRYTSARDAVTYNAEKYTPAPIRRSEIEQTQEFVGGGEVGGVVAADHRCRVVLQALPDRRVTRQQLGTAGLAAFLAAEDQLGAAVWHGLAHAVTPPSRRATATGLDGNHAWK